MQVAAARLLCLAGLLGALAAGAPASAAGAPAGADAIELLGAEQLSPRLSELSLRTPAVAEPTAVRVLLPDGYEVHPRRRYPALYLLHGALDDYRSWTGKGDAEALTAGLELIVVMPDSGPTQGYTDWYNGGRFGPPAWETYHVTQLIEWIDRRYRTIASRRGRAIAGLSMGGGGAMHYAARHPDMFVHAAGFSPAVDLTHPGLITLNQLGPPSPDGSNSPAYGPYATQEVRWRGHNPLDLAENLRGLELSLRTGNGLAGGEYGGTRDLVEMVVHEMAVSLHERLDGFAIEHLFDDYGNGSHTWPYWQRDLRLELPLIMAGFAHPPPRPRRFSFVAVEPSYEDYGWRVRFKRGVLEFSRIEVNGRRRFKLSGSGSAVVRTPPHFEPGAKFRVSLRGDRRASVIVVRAGGDGALRIPVKLGPANPYQQYTAEARFAGTTVFNQRVRIRPR